MIASGLFLASCITQTITDFEYFTVQIPIFFETKSKDKESPDTARDFSNLYSYDQYRNNKDKISAAEIFQFNYRIDSLVMINGIPFNPLTDDLVFDNIKFSLQFALPKSGNIYTKDSTQFMPDPLSPVYVLGEYKDVNVKDFYKKAYHILSLADSTAIIISNTLKTTPYFYIYTEYSKIKGQTTDVVKFPYILAKYDVVVRLKVKL
jgi:hypothetical protein